MAARMSPSCPRCRRSAGSFAASRGGRPRSGGLIVEVGVQPLRVDGRRISVLQMSIDQHGLAGLRTTRLQYRRNPASHPARSWRRRHLLFRRLIFTTSLLVLAFRPLMQSHFFLSRHPGCCCWFLCYVRLRELAPFEQDDDADDGHKGERQQQIEQPENQQGRQDLDRGYRRHGFDEELEDAEAARGVRGQRRRSLTLTTASTAKKLGLPLCGSAK